jgi:hypothetical protein
MGNKEVTLFNMEDPIVYNQLRNEIRDQLKRVSFKTPVPPVTEEELALYLHQQDDEEYRRRLKPDHMIAERNKHK